MTDTHPEPTRQDHAEHRLVVFDAPTDLDPCFRENGFAPYGKQRGAWVRVFASVEDPEAQDLEYEMRGVGLSPRWWSV